MMSQNGPITTHNDPKVKLSHKFGTQPN